MSVTTTFGGKVRSAGTLDDDNLIRLGSIRSYKRLEAASSAAAATTTTNLDDGGGSFVVASKLKFESSEKENSTKKSHHHHHRRHHSKQREERDRDKGAKDSSHHRHREGSAAARSHSKNNNHHKSAPDEEAKEEDLLESLRRINSSRRQRRQVNSDTFNRKDEEEAPQKQESAREKLAANSHSNLPQDDEENRRLSRHARRGSLDVLRRSPTERSANKLAVNGSEPPRPRKLPDSESDDDETVAVDIAKSRHHHHHQQVQQRHESSSVERPSGQLINDFGLEYFKLIRDTSMLNFILSPPPQGNTIRCKIICQKGIFNQYSFYLEDADRNDILLMKTHRLVTTHVKQVITCVDRREAYGHASEIQCAKIKSNISRKKFKLELENSVATKNQTEILNIAFKSNISEPRRIYANTSLCAGLKGTDHIVTYFFKNRQPYYDFQQKKFVLDYCGRAKQSSKNNFQIVDESYPDDIILQLGKVETGWYNCDFSFPLCALQAFGFALSSLSR